jgi:hypothetical protein
LDLGGSFLLGVGMLKKLLCHTATQLIAQTTATIVATNFQARSISSPSSRGA